jgi:hypothetical protein
LVAFAEWNSQSAALSRETSRADQFATQKVIDKRTDLFGDHNIHNHSSSLVGDHMYHNGDHLESGIETRFAATGHSRLCGFPIIHLHQY